MAENNTLTQTTVLKVETVKAVKSVQDLRDNIKTLRKVVNEATIGTDEYAAAQEELAAQQNALREIQKGSAASIEEVTKAAAGLGTSYAALVNQMKALTAEYRTTEDAAQRAKLAEQIKNINDQLKDMDSTRGVFSRHVGDYANQMSKALGGLSGIMGPLADGLNSVGAAGGGMVNPIQSANGAMTTLSMNPVVGTISVLVQLLSSLIKSLKSNEETMNAFRVALAPLNALGTQFTRWVQKAGEDLVVMVEKTMKAVRAVGKFLGLITEEDEKLAAEHKKIVEEEVALTKRQRETERLNAESAKEISELKAKAAEKDKYTAEQRLAFLNKAADEEKAIADRNLQLAQDEYNNLKRKSELAGNSKEENEELNRSYIKLIETQTAYNNKMKELNATRSEAVKQMKKEQDEAVNLENTLRDIIADMEIAEDTFEKVEDEISLPKDQWAERAKLMQENIDREVEMQVKKNKLLIEDEQTRADEEWRIRMEAEERKLDVLREAEENTTDPFAKLELQRQIANMEVDIEIEKNKRIKEENEKALTDKQEMWSRAAEITAFIGSMTTGILDDIANSMEVTNAKEFKRQQDLQVASATINMIAGAAGAFMQAMASYPGPIGPAVGAVMSAVALTTGAMQIRKIKQQKYKGGSSAPSTSSAPAAVSPPNIETQLPTVRTLTGAKEEERLNRMASPVRAYIVDSDLQAKERERDVIEEETSF